jgi:hypothetical protein
VARHRTLRRNTAVALLGIALGTIGSYAVANAIDLPRHQDARGRDRPVSAAPDATPPDRTPAPPTVNPPIPRPEQPAAEAPRPQGTPAKPGTTILGQGDSGEQVRILQARLQQIDWFDAEVTGNYGELTAAAVVGFQAKRGLPATGAVDQRTWTRLLGMTRAPTADELYNRRADNPSSGAAIDPRCLTGHVLCVDKTSRSLRWVVDGHVQLTLDARFGAESMPTREGSFEVYLKSRDHVSKLYGSSMPFAMFFSGGQAVHYSPDFAAHGYEGASHGCVNIRDLTAIESLFDEVQVGDAVVVYRS